MAIRIFLDEHYVLACPDRGASNDPKVLGLAKNHRALHSFTLMNMIKLLQTWLIETGLTRGNDLPSRRRSQSLTDTNETL